MPEKISLALGSSKKPFKPAATNGIKRSHAALQDEDDDGHEEGARQTVSHFDKNAGGAIDAASRKRDEGPLVIAPQANRDWRDASKRRKQRHGVPAETQKDVSEQAIKEMEAAKPAFGLSVAPRKREGEEPAKGNEAHGVAEALEPASKDTDGEAPAAQKTDEELAMDALLGKETQSNLVLPTMSESEAFTQDYTNAPDLPTLEDYARIPVEQFGAALLRGMGWKDGEGIGSAKGQKLQTTKLPERRPALLGIGAKEEAAVAQELGVWGKAAKRGGGEVKVYNPVLLRDKRTGELFTEEELEKKKERDRREEFEREFERKEKERERRGERRDRRDERPAERERDTKHRDRRRADDSDEEYHRRKEKERRHKERDRESDRLRHRHRDREDERPRHRDSDRRR